MYWVISECSVFCAGLHWRDSIDRSAVFNRKRFILLGKVTPALAFEAQFEKTNMAEEQVIEVDETCAPKEPTVPRRDDGRRYLLALLSMAALMCSSMELEFLQRLDGMRQYMTISEIFWDASVALIVLFGATIGWWLCLLLVAKIADIIPWTARYSRFVFWYLGLAIPLLWFVFVLCNAARLWVYPQWHPGLSGVLWLSLAAISLCIAGLCMNQLPVLQGFCRIQLVPIGWFHIILVATAVIALWAHGMHLFHEFAHPGKAVAASDQPDVYLITIDALRADDMSLYGYSRPTTPNLERFARRAFTFDFFFANSNFTTPATTSIETGKLPWTHRVFHQGGYLRGQAQRETLGTLLEQRGYYTATISSNYFASPLHHKTQDSYDAVGLPESDNLSGTWSRHTNLVGFTTLYTLSGPLLKPLSLLRRYLDAVVWSNRYASPAEVVFDRARAVVERRDITQPRFVWAHILPPHDPYLPPLPYRGRFLSGDKLTRNYDFLGLRTDAPPSGISVAELRARYDENISYADQVVGDFLDWLDQTGRLDRSIVIVSADHGESFEHDWFTHGGPDLYNGVIRIPLLIHIPGQKRGSRITQAAEEVDLLPTILDLIGGQAPRWGEGASLKLALEGEEGPHRLLFSMNLEPNSTFEPITHGTVAVIDNEFKCIDRLGTQEVSLYRYRTDPDEEHNLVDSEPVVAARMKASLVNKVKEINGRVIVKP
jgi:arylsulfatase A-like enzyme